MLGQPRRPPPPTTTPPRPAGRWQEEAVGPYRFIPTINFPTPNFATLKITTLSISRHLISRHYYYLASQSTPLANLAAVGTSHFFPSSTFVQFSCFPLSFCFICSNSLLCSYFFSIKFLALCHLNSQVRVRLMINSDFLANVVFKVFKFSSFQVFKTFLVPSFCLIFRHFYF